MVQIYATTHGRDLGAVAADIQKIIAQNDKAKPKGAIVALIGQTATMNLTPIPACCSVCSGRSYSSTC